MYGGALGARRGRAQTKVLPGGPGPALGAHTMKGDQFPSRPRGAGSGVTGRGGEVPSPWDVPVTLARTRWVDAAPVRSRRRSARGDRWTIGVVGRWRGCGTRSADGLMAGWARCASAATDRWRVWSPVGEWVTGVGARCVPVGGWVAGVVGAQAGATAGRCWITWDVERAGGRRVVLCGSPSVQRDESRRQVVYAQ